MTLFRFFFTIHAIWAYLLLGVPTDAIFSKIDHINWFIKVIRVEHNISEDNLADRLNDPPLLCKFLEVNFRFCSQNEIISCGDIRGVKIASRTSGSFYCERFGNVACVGYEHYSVKKKRVSLFSCYECPKGLWFGFLLQIDKPMIRIAHNSNVIVHNTRNSTVRIISRVHDFDEIEKSGVKEVVAKNPPNVRTPSLDKHIFCKA